ncbi:hypothetical protein D3C76_1734780 [compost metagenome]
MSESSDFSLDLRSLNRARLTSRSPWETLASPLTTLPANFLKESADTLPICRMPSFVSLPSRLTPSLNSETLTFTASFT